MEPLNEENNHSEVIHNLLNMFGNVMNKDAIAAVVESCDGDVHEAIDAIMNMTNDDNNTAVTDTDNETVTSNESRESSQTPQSTISYASVAHTSVQPTQNKGAIPKIIPRATPSALVWTDQIREILSDHNQGTRTLIFMRGAPGSGKTHLSKQLVDMMVGSTYSNHTNHILSTDDYFMVRGQYLHDKYKLHEAHLWNQNRARDALRTGLSPVIIDNTNIEFWEMEPYLRDGVQNGYIIQVVEPTTPWAKKANQLVKKNIHNVPLGTIRRALNNLCSITGEKLKQTYGLSYPANMVPPVKRSMPPVPDTRSPPKTIIINKSTNSIHVGNSTHTNSHTNYVTNPDTLDVQTQQMDHNLAQEHNVTETEPESDQNIQNNECYELTSEEKRKQKSFLEALKRLEESILIANEWENGGNWDETVETQSKVDTASTLKLTENPINNPSLSEAKPPRKLQNQTSTENISSESLMQAVSNCQDWNSISMFMPPWIDSSDSSQISIANQPIPVEKVSNSTCMEVGDTNINGKLKVIMATPRNINEFHISFRREKIPDKRMLDKSSMTNEETFVSESFRCPNEEKHFIAFRKLFKNLARADLRDIFDKCCGDVNWAVEIVFDGMSNNQFITVDEEELSDPEEENSEQCECLANYNIIPDSTPDTVQETQMKETEDDTQTSAIACGLQTQKKKREATISDENIQIKRRIEQNFVIADNHYSKHCLRIRKLRRGEPDINDMTEESSNIPSTSTDTSPLELQNANNLATSDEDDDYNVSVNGDDMVTVNLGQDFLALLDEKFGRTDVQYPDYIKPTISIPFSLLNEINALWMESVADQLDEHTERTAAMMEQDQEFARQLAVKEHELYLAGKEPEVPDFKEIMDMDFALALYQKDVAEWRNNIPTDMAAKMTRDKLFNLFPDVDKETLNELLMAHDNNFKATVEVLLMSTGRSEIVEAENGINKFIVEKELHRKDQILEQERKELSEEEWPLLSKDDQVDMNTVEAYRQEADQHLARRNQNYQKAQDCVRRGMTQVANYYSEIADFHKQKYEHANSMAVASLMQYHSLNSPNSTTIDLHFLRVKEAKEALDLFIDAHISKLRESGNRRKLTLYFITGRGQHSPGRARIKPATISRLRERGIGYTLRNPGLLSAKVNVDTKLTYLLP